MLLRSLLHPSSAKAPSGDRRLRPNLPDGDGQAPVCTLRLKSRHLDWSIALNPSIGLAEAYMNGLIVIEDGTLYDFLDLIVRNSAKVGLDEHWLTLGTGALLRLARRIKRYNPIHRARRNVAHHYDLSEGCTVSSWTTICRIPAPISVNPASAWSRRRSRRSAC